ncbi:hypothetical protein AVEN_252421-1 [Araneus ventricosus]|uniref:ATP-dependent DNA helicase n=1 Tax=Araneus ventricosus TaxID=182803 RepID=A0A4Y2ARV8_ARAVE|nr:hypothetical protein AVEN_252421-1 [Araneus ventricosus]
MQSIGRIFKTQQELKEAVFLNVAQHFIDYSWLCQREIPTSRNEDVSVMNKNLHPPSLCNGTRLCIKKLLTNIIEATIMTGHAAASQKMKPAENCSVSSSARKLGALKISSSISSSKGCEVVWATSRSRVPVDGAAIASDVRESSCREQQKRRRGG